MSETTCTPFISETEHFRKKRFRQKLWVVLNDPFSDLISLIFDGVTKVRAMSL